MNQAWKMELVMAALHRRCGHYIFCPVVSIFLLFSPRLISAVADWMPTVWYFHTWCGPSANLECRSEMCCTQLAGNVGPKDHQKFAIRAPLDNKSS